MSDQDGENSPMRTEASHRNATHNESMEDTLAANNSIIGKVKSRVSSIFPNSLSKWFSPSTKNNNDSLNGSISKNSNNSNLSRRRRRIEVDEEEEEEDEDGHEDDEEDVEDDDEEHESGDFDGNLFSLEPDRNYDDDEDEGDDNSEESNNSDLAVTTVTRENLKHSRHGNIMRTSTAVRQPPTKRSRLNLDHTFTTKGNRNTPLIQRQPLLSSTPDIGGGALTNQFSPGSRSTNRYTHLNLYGNQVKKEPAYNFSSSPVVNAMASSTMSPRYDPDIIDLVPEQAVDSNIRSGGADLVSSRRSLNIPTTTAAYSTTERSSTGLSNLKRQSLASVKNVITSLPKRTSTTIFETDTSVGNMSLRATPQQQQQQQNQQQLQAQKHNSLQSNVILEEREEDFQDNNNEVILVDDLDELQQSKKCNGEATFKRQKLTNGAGVALKHSKNTPLMATKVHVRDSASESSDGGGGGKAEISTGTTGGILPRKTAGLFNISASNSRNGSRTSSFGNGLNFYTHLEGRKSLFSGGTGPQAGTSGGTPLNNSTLSLTSLNRRQFNASIYGSTSALSDSRLLNTFSPFYKGKTTYGGAAAYNKYSMSGTTGTGAGASAVRITPTLIRPTSSLSTLSSSNNSTSAVGVHVTENPSAISSTAKRILDLINDFATPLSEAKKMASNLKSSHHHQQSALNQSLSKTQRFNETDLMATRAMRLSQVRTPYSRPSVTLIPNAASNSTASLPPVRELQVPSMSQLLQMKKMQQTTERSRQIATEKNSYIGGVLGGALETGVAADYTLPSDLDAAADSCRSQKQHTNKIKNKVTRSGRTAGSKDSAMASSIDDEAPSAPVNLPNIAFPLMQSVPKFDINLLPSTKTTKPTTVAEVHSVKETKGYGTMDSQSKTQLESLKHNFALTGAVSALHSSNTSKTSIVKEFTFSTPIQVESASSRTQNITPISGNYKFSAPMIVGRNTHSQQQQQQQELQQQSQPQPQLKTGSVLDALKKPFTLPSAAPPVALASPTVAANDSLFAQFKKSSNEWECDTCMIRNKHDVSKCVACETPRKLVSSSATKVSEPISTATSTKTVFGSFGNQFKKTSGEWECDTCLIRNKQDVTRCVACETPRKQATSSNVESIKPSFGDAFKPKANTWECSTCLINNKAEANECVACETKKPGSTLKQVVSTLPPTIVDAGFKSLVAAQKASKWECEACMTRNDASKLKCVCCEQAKPGSNAVNENVPKFNFGSTAAAKFSFGFGNQNTPKEEELRKASEKEKNASLKPSPKPGVCFSKDSSPKLAPPSVPSTAGGFTFGIKPIVPVETPTKTTDAKDTVDTGKTMSTTSATTSTTAAPILSGFKFGVVNSTVSNTTSTTFTSASTSTTKAGFAFGATTGISSTATSKPSESTVTNPAPTVKFNLPTTNSASTTFDNTKSTTQNVSTSIFGTSASQESTFKPVQQPANTAGFSFGLSKPAADATKTPSITIATTGATDAEPKSSGFSFKAPTSVASTSTASNTFTFGATPATSVSSGTKIAASTESMLLFRAPTAAPSAVSASSASTTLAKPTSGGFSFGSLSAVSSTSTTTSTKPSFFGVTPTTTTATTSTISTTTSTVTTPTANIFGSFGTASTAGNSVFGSTTVANANSSSSTTTSTFGTLAATSATCTPFGAFGNTSNNTVTSKTNATPLFGSTTISSSPAPFSFGTSANVSTAASVAVTNTTTVSSSTTWPKNSFVFGSSTATTTTPAGSATLDATKPPAFGTATFGTSLTQPVANNASTSIFGSNPQASGTSNFAAAATFGSVVASTPIFGASSTAAPASSVLASSNNLFGGSTGATNITASASTPVFGSSPFGGSSTAAAAVVAPTFGNAASSAAGGIRSATTNTFGGFGAAAAAASNTTDGASAAKKSEPAFNFGATPVAPQAPSGGFNFGSGAGVAKPAFNFGASTGTTASFNFTGANTEIPKSSQPFQFGATSTPLAPVFNFSGVAAEQTPNAAPFQFNAGSAQPAINNIFAPTPTPPGAQAAQQARRKVRPPMRRLTPR